MQRFILIAFVIIIVLLGMGALAPVAPASDTAQIVDPMPLDPSDHQALSMQDTGELDHLTAGDGDDIAIAFLLFLFLLLLLSAAAAGA